MGDGRVWCEAGAFENLGLQMRWPRCAVVVGHGSQGQVLVESSGLEMSGDGRRETGDGRREIWWETGDGRRLGGDQVVVA